MRSRRSGFTIIELLAVMVIIGILVQIAIPQYRNLRKRGEAASIVSDVRAIQIAAFSYYTEHGKFPAAGASGKAPPELEPLLPTGFSFSRDSWTYRWHQWTDGKGASAGGSLVGVKVSSNDPELIAILANTGGKGFVPIATGGFVVFLIASTQ